MKLTDPDPVSSRAILIPLARSAPTASLTSS